MNIQNANLKFNGDLTPRISTKKIVLHHIEAIKATVQDIHSWHLVNTWAGIGYHLYIRKDGTVWQGRPLNTIGAHCLSNNEDSIGIAVEGNYETTDKTMPQTQKLALIEAIRYVQGQYPDCAIYGHKELNSTSCPGKYYPLAEMKAIKVQAANFYQALPLKPQPSKDSFNPIVNSMIDAKLIPSKNWAIIAKWEAYLGKGGKISKELF